MGTKTGTEPLTAEEELRGVLQAVLLAGHPDVNRSGGHCQCIAHEDARNILRRAARSSTPLDDGPQVLPDDTVCACLDETGTRTVRRYVRCERCHAFMADDESVPAPLDDGGLDAAWREAEALFPETWSFWEVTGYAPDDDLPAKVFARVRLANVISPQGMVPEASGQGTTPAAALRALAETLRNRE
jgi:hypothetical protein